MATATLTVTVDQELLERAERLAAARNTTVSEMVERLLRIVAQPPLLRSELPPVTRSALGMAPPLSDEEVERILDEERMRKYGQP
jgi:hypothetical protein